MHVLLYIWTNFNKLLFMYKYGYGLMNDNQDGRKADISVSL